MRKLLSMMLAFLAMGAAGCGSQLVPDSAAPAGDTQVRMDFDRAGGFYDAPFPSADLQSADGRVDLARFPNPERIGIVDQALNLITRDADGFALTGGVFFSLSAPIDAAQLPDVQQSLTSQAPVFLISVADQTRVPVQVDFAADGGPFGAPNLLSLLPYQGIPLKPQTRYAAVVCATLRDAEGRRLRINPVVDGLAHDIPPAGLSERQGQDYLAGYRAAASQCTVAGLAVFTTGAPAAALVQFTDAARREAVPIPGRFVRGEVFDGYCVYATTIDMPDYQQGVPPYGRSGGDWRVDAEGEPLAPHFETANLYVTIPRAAMPAAGFPLVTFVRAGGGGDRPLVDRGVHLVAGGPAAIPGSGPAQEFARVGYAGIQVDGPLGGLRNTTQGDEQILVFNVFNLAALRDNVRESALELAVLSDVIDTLEIDSSDCPGAPPVSRFDAAQRVLMGHSTGATIAPLALAIDPHLRAAILSGEGGSYIENILYKRNPVPILPVALNLLHYTDRTLTEHDPVMSLVQWALESADPPVYADFVIRDPRYRAMPAHVLMLQGIVDNYILPNIANASSLSLGLDLVGPALDDPANPALAGQTSLLSVLPLSGRRQIDYPARCNLSLASGCVTAVVAQHPGDGVEDGHEVVFQTEPPKQQYRAFLETLLQDVPTVPSK